MAEVVIYESDDDDLEYDSDLDLESENSIFKNVRAGEFTCHVCQEKFKYELLLFHHMRGHNSIHECEECPKRFEARVLLKRHCEIAHKPYNERKYVCDENDCKFRKAPMLIHTSQDVYVYASVRKLHFEKR